VSLKLDEKEFTYAIVYLIHHKLFTQACSLLHICLRFSFLITLAKKVYS